MYRHWQITDNKRRKQQNSHFSDTDAVGTLSSSQIKEIVVGKGLFALHRKIWFAVCKKIENFVITNFLFS